MSASTRSINTLMNMITMLINGRVCAFALGVKKLERSIGQSDKRDSRDEE